MMNWQFKTTWQLAKITSKNDHSLLSSSLYIFISFPDIARGGRTSFAIKKGKKVKRDAYVN